jgi:hypothetical protein
VIDDPAINLLWNAVIETAISRLHVEDRNSKTLGGQGREATIRVSENQDSIRPELGESFARFCDDQADCFGRSLTCRLQKDVGPANFKVLEKNLIQFVVIVLAGVNQHVLGMPIQRRDYTRQPNDFRSSSKNGCNFHSLSGANLCGSGYEFEISGKQWPDPVEDAAQ